MYGLCNLAAWSRITSGHWFYWEGCFNPVPKTKDRNNAGTSLNTSSFSKHQGWLVQ